MRKLPWVALVSLPLLSDPAAAVWYIYQGAPTTPTVNGQGIWFQVNDVGRTEPRLSETFHLTSTLNTGQTPASSRSLVSDVTLTTDATGAVVAWTATGHWTIAFLTWTYSSSLQGNQFVESITLNPLTSPPSGPFFSPAPGTWQLADSPIPVPEPASLALWLTGLGVVTALARHRRQSIRT